MAVTGGTVNRCSSTWSASALCSSTDLPRPYVTKLLGHVIRRRQGDFPILARTDGPGPLTVLHMIGADHLDDYERRAREWSIAVWESWNAQHALIQTELDAVRNNTRS